MQNFFIYIIQVNILLSILSIAYLVLLRGLTFYNLNRIYFLIGAGYALIFPFTRLQNWFQEITPFSPIELPESIILPVSQIETSSSYTLADLILMAIYLGACIFTLKLIFQLSSYIRIHTLSVLSEWKNYIYRQINSPILPFSFFRTIYLNKKQHTERELNDIFKHESIHAQQLHTIDVLFFEVLTILCWYNPFVWLMRRSVRQNLEYLTDRKVLTTGTDRQSYQYSLLNTAQQGQSIGISNHFNFKTLKKRIIMMNKKKSHQIELGKYVFLFPLVIFIGAGFTARKAEANIEKAVAFTQKTELNYLPSAIDPTLNTQDTVKKTKESIKNLSEGKNNLYQIDNKIVSAEEFNSLDPKKVNHIEVRKDFALPEGVAPGNYDGLVIATTQESSGNQLKNEKPIIVLDGEIMDKDFSLDTVDPNSIEKIEILKDEKATEKYGEKAKDGAIIITKK